MLLSDLVNRSRSTDSLFSKIYKKAEQDPEYKRAITSCMKLTCKLPDANAAIFWLTKISNINANLKKDIDALKEEFRAHRIASLTNASVGIVGAANFWNPFGIGLMISSGVSEITNSITEICISKRKEVNEKIKLLQTELSEPFKSLASDLADFIKGYQELNNCVQKVVGEDDVQEVLNVIFGCMYLLDCHIKPSNINKCWNMWMICYNDSKINIDSDLKYIIEDCSRFREYFVGNSILFGVGVTVMSLCKLGPTVFGNMVNSINKMMNVGLTVSQNLLTTMRLASIISKAAVSVTVVLSIYTLINDSIEIHKIDETYKPYYEINTKIDEILDGMKTIPIALCEHICSVQKYSLLCKRIEENAIDN